MQQQQQQQKWTPSKIVWLVIFAVLALIALAVLLTSVTSDSVSAGQITGQLLSPPAAK